MLAAARRASAEVAVASATHCSSACTSSCSLPVICKVAASGTMSRCRAHTDTQTHTGRHAGTQGHNATTQPRAYRGVREAVLAHEHLDLRWRCLLTVEAMAAVIYPMSTHACTFPPHATKQRQRQLKQWQRAPRTETVRFHESQTSGACPVFDSTPNGGYGVTPRRVASTLRVSAAPRHLGPGADLACTCQSPSALGLLAPGASSLASESFRYPSALLR